LLLLFLSLGASSILGGDGVGYHRLALNILDHFSFSLAEAPPYEPTLARAPGYPLFIALTYSISGRSLVSLRIAQFILLAATAWLLYILALRFVTRRAAVVAAILCATYLPFVFIAAYHLTETLSTFLTVLLVFSLVCALQNSRRRPVFAFVTGMIVGIAGLVRPSLTLLVIISLAVFTIQSVDSEWRWRALAGAMVATGFMLCVLPWSLRNIIVSHQLTPFATGSGGSGWSLYVSAQQYANEISYKVTSSEWAQIIAEYNTRADKAWQVVTNAETFARKDYPVSPNLQQELILDREYARDGWQKLRSVGLRQILQSLPTRLAYLWSTGDVSPWATGLFHRFAQTHYAIMLLLIVLGCYFSRATLLSHIPLWIAPVYLTLVHLVFHVEPRYSFPARPFLFVYAGVTLEPVASLIRSAARSVIKGKRSDIPKCAESLERFQE
jgi:4-amino-4-deoxy-L-arabinose transferase-like glycosyltransferase